MKKLLLSLTLSASLLVTPALAAEAVTFTDVAADAWYAPYVEACAEDGLMKGAGGGRFDPGGVMTLPEALTLAARIARPELRLTQEVSIPESLEELGLSVLPLLPIGQVTLLDGAVSLLYTVEGRVLDWTGALVCDLSAYDQYDFFLPDGAARVQKDGLYGYVNKHTGAEVVPCRYREATLLHDGVLLAGSAEEGFTAFDTSGNVLGHLDGSVNCVNTVGDLVQYADKDTGLYGYLNPDGSVAVEAGYTSVYPFSGGYAAVRDESGLAGFINTEGELVIPCQFAVVSNGFSDEGYAVVGTAGDYSSPLHYNGKLGIVNTGGILVVPQIYDSLGNFYADGLAPFLRWTEEGTPVAGYLTTDGTERFPGQLAGTASLPFPFASGLAIFEENGLYGLMDAQFETALPAAFGFCIPSASGSHAIVEADGMLFRVALK